VCVSFLFSFFFSVFLVKLFSIVYLYSILPFVVNKADQSTVSYRIVFPVLRFQHRSVRLCDDRHAIWRKWVTPARQAGGMLGIGLRRVRLSAWQPARCHRRSAHLPSCIPPRRACSTLAPSSGIRADWRQPSRCSPTKRRWRFIFIFIHQKTVEKKNRERGETFREIVNGRMDEFIFCRNQAERTDINHK